MRLYFIPYILLSLLILSNIISVLGAPGSIPFYSPETAWNYDPTFGTTYIIEGCSFNTISVTGTGGLFDFTNFYWNLTSSTWDRFGFGCDTIGQHMNITSMTDLTITIKPSTTNITGRIWAPDRSQITNISGATYTWDTTNRVVTFLSDGSPSIILTFDTATPYISPSAPLILTSTHITQSANTLAQLLPIIALVSLIGIAKNPNQWKNIVGFAVSIAVIIIFGQVFNSMGF